MHFHESISSSTYQPRRISPDNYNWYVGVCKRKNWNPANRIEESEIEREKEKERRTSRISLSLSLFRYIYKYIYRNPSLATFFSSSTQKSKHGNTTNPRNQSIKYDHYFHHTIKTQKRRRFSPPLLLPNPNSDFRTRSWWVKMSSLSRELVFLILQFLEEEKFKETVHR